VLGRIIAGPVRIFQRVPVFGQDHAPSGCTRIRVPGFCWHRERGYRTGDMEIRSVQVAGDPGRRDGFAGRAGKKAVNETGEGRKKPEKLGVKQQQW